MVFGQEISQTDSLYFIDGKIEGVEIIEIDDSKVMYKYSGESFVISANLKKISKLLTSNGRVINFENTPENEKIKNLDVEPFKNTLPEHPVERVVDIGLRKSFNSNIYKDTYWEERSNGEKKVHKNVGHDILSKVLAPTIKPAEFNDRATIIRKK
jgi:hypothetical protein